MLFKSVWLESISTSLSHVTICSGDIKERGLVLPLSKEIYKPMLKKLELEGIVERREVETEDF